MIQHQLTVFFKMGGFGDYIWSAYGITTVILLGLLFAALFSQNKLKRHLRQQQKLIR